MQYDRNDMDFHRGTFRVRGDVVEIIPAYESDVAIRVEFFGDEIDRITEVDVLTGEIRRELNHIALYPASHYVVSNGADPGGHLRPLKRKWKNRWRILKVKTSFLRHRESVNGRTLIWR